MRFEKIKLGQNFLWSLQDEVYNNRFISQTVWHFYVTYIHVEVDNNMNNNR